MKKKTETRGRKPVQDKKTALRIYVEQSLIDANGGELQAKEICILSLKSGAKKNKKF
jgi:hypothetical protein